jgi:small conductance mechanosensitive channel
MNIDFEKWKEIGITYSFKILGALVVLLLGLLVISMLKKSVDTFMKRGSKDDTLRIFLVSLMDISLKVLLLITVISMMGIQMASFVAVIGAAGLAIGLALQGSLSNFAAGVMILVFGVYKVGDFIEAKGYMGRVKEIQIFHTVIETNEGLRVIIPNSMLSAGALIIHIDK